MTQPCWLGSIITSRQAGAGAAAAGAVWEKSPINEFSQAGPKMHHCIVYTVYMIRYTDAQMHHCTRYNTQQDQRRNASMLDRDCTLYIDRYILSETSVFELQCALLPHGWDRESDRRSHMNGSWNLCQPICVCMHSSAYKCLDDSLRNRGRGVFSNHIKLGWIQLLVHTLENARLIWILFGIKQILDR